MRSAARTEGRELRGAGGRVLGWLGPVLFHLHEPRAVGYTVRRRRFLWVIERKPRYVTLSEVDYSDKEHPVLLASKLPGLKASERALGGSWDETVIWRGMPVNATDGERLGRVSDVVFSATSGAVGKVKLSGGVASDVAVGRAELPGDAVQGFDGSAVVVDTAYEDLAMAGGIAAGAGKGAAKARDAAGKAAKKAGRFGIASLKALESVVTHEGAKKVLRGARRAADQAMRDAEGRP